MKISRQISRRLMGWSWVLLQCLALLAILFTPLWLQKNTVLPYETLQANSKVRHPSISSQVIHIPRPHLFENQSGDWVHEVIADVRQVRFEWLTPASGAESQWSLKSISRVRAPAGVRSDVSLVADEEGQFMGSSYVELQSTEEIFMVEISDSAKASKDFQKKKMFIRVKLK